MNSLFQGYYLLYAASIFSLIIACCPLVDYYCNWYITLLPIILLLFGIKGENMHYLIRCLFVALIYSLFEFWIVHRKADFLIETRNNMMAFTPLVACSFFKGEENRSFRMMYLQLFLILMSLTGITSIIGFNIFPMAARELAGSHESEEAITYLRMNIGGFDYIYGAVLSIPVFFWFIFNSTTVRKRLNIILLAINTFAIYRSNYTTAFLLTIVAYLLSLIVYKPQFKKQAIFAGVLLLFLGTTGIWSMVFKWLSDVVESEYVSDRLLQLSFLFSGTDVSDIDTDTTTERLELMETATDAFFSSPLWGKNIIEYHKEFMSGHSLIMDILAGAGVLGLAFVLLLFKRLFRLTNNCNWRQSSEYVKVLWVLFVCLSYANPSGFMLLYMAITTNSFIIQSNLSKNE